MAPGPSATLFFASTGHWSTSSTTLVSPDHFWRTSLRRRPVWCLWRRRKWRMFQQWSSNFSSGPVICNLFIIIHIFIFLMRNVQSLKIIFFPFVSKFYVKLISLTIFVPFGGLFIYICFNSYFVNFTIWILVLKLCFGFSETSAMELWSSGHPEFWKFLPKVFCKTATLKHLQTYYFIYFYQFISIPYIHLLKTSTSVYQFISIPCIRILKTRAHKSNGSQHTH